MTEYMSTGDGMQFQYNNCSTITTGLNLTTTQKNLEGYLFDREERKQKKEITMNKKKKGLYQVILIDPKEGMIIFNEYVICSKPEDVLLEAGAGEIIKARGLKVSEVDKIVNLMGEVRNTRKNKDGIVEIENEE